VQIFIFLFRVVLKSEKILTFFIKVLTTNFYYYIEVELYFTDFCTDLNLSTRIYDKKIDCFKIDIVGGELIY